MSKVVFCNSRMLSYVTIGTTTFEWSALGFFMGKAEGLNRSPSGGGKSIHLLLLFNTNILFLIKIKIFLFKH